MLDIFSITQSILLLLIVLDPFSNAPYFYTLTKELRPEVRSSMIEKSVIVAALILLVFAVFGDSLLKFLGVTVDDFRVAGGIILLIYSILGLLEISLMPRPDLDKITIVPMATPLLAGPGAITVVIYIKYNWDLVAAVSSIIVSIMITLAILLIGGRILRLLGRNGTLVLDKMMSMLMAAYAVSLMREGILNLIV
ncbi:MAG: MarC family protein [Nitrososphaeria archaeon]